MNKSQFIGNLAADAEVVQGANGEFIKFRLGVTNRYTNRAGEQVNATEWVNCTMSKNAVLPYLVKGKEVLVEGRIKAEAYMKKDSSEPEASLTLRVSEVRLLGGRTSPEAGGSQSTPVGDVAASKPTPFSSYRSLEDEEGDLPF